MQLKRAIESAILHKLPVHKEYMCLCLVSTLFLRFVMNSSIVVKALIHGFDLYYITFYMCSKCATFLCTRTHRNAIRLSIDICLF